MSTEFVPVLLGADINAYSMARAFHEAYGVKSIVFGMFAASVCAGSKIIDYRVRENNDRVDKVLENVTEVAREHPDKKILVLGCGDNYLNAISANLPHYPENVIAPYVDLATLEGLIHKEKFYDLCDKYGIDHPATVVYHKGMGHDFTLPFDGPFVVKPAESDTYWKHPFPTQKKAYVLQTREEVDQVIDQIYDAGKSCELTITKNRHLWWVIPPKVAYDYVNPKYHEEMKALQAHNAVVNPLFYHKDNGLIHKLRILKGQRRYVGWYASCMEKVR